MITLSIDELRVASRRLGATLPTVLDEYGTDDPAADAAAVRSLAARGLAEAQLRAVLAPLVTSASVIELELVGPGENALRCAEAWGADGTVRSLSEQAPGVWRLSDAPMIDVSRVPAVDRPLDGAPVRLPLERHVELDELLAARRLAEIAALLGSEGAQLAAAFADSGCTSGRLSRSWRTPDEGLAVDCCAWVAHARGAWLITDADPDAAYPATTFTPVDDATLRAEIARVRDGVQREAAPA